VRARQVIGRAHGFEVEVDLEGALVEVAVADAVTLLGFEGLVVQAIGELDVVQVGICRHGDMPEVLCVETAPELAA